MIYILILGTCHDSIEIAILVQTDKFKWFLATGMEVSDYWILVIKLSDDWSVYQL